MKIQNVIQIPILIVCIGLLPKAQAVVPAPDGGYPGGNTAEGQNALFSLTTGGFNTAAGFLSLSSNTTGSFNTAIGAGTLLANTGDENTATGAGALLSNTTGFRNTAHGAFALFSNTIGFNNTATGREALFSNIGGGSNTAVGSGALFSSTGVSNTALGAGAGIAVTTANSVICIGSAGRNVNNGCFIGNIRSRQTQIADAIPVLIDSNEQLGTASSSRRFKREIKPMDKASEAILALKPVAFHYKSDKTNTPQFGLIAEEVAEVNPNLVVRDKNGEIYTVRYDAVNAMLLNEFLKEHRTVQELKSTVAKQEAIIAKQQNGFESKIARQQKQIEALTMGLQKVSDQLELSKPAPRTVSNNQ
jgi:endosialidase-like protein